MIAAVVWSLTALALAGPLVWGGRQDRTAATILLAGMVLTWNVSQFHVGSFRWGVALVDLVGFLALLLVTLERRRWWLIPLTSVQLLTLTTHGLTLAHTEYSIWAASTARLLLWGLMIIFLGLGGREAFVVRKYRLEEAFNGADPHLR